MIRVNAFRAFVALLACSSLLVLGAISVNAQERTLPLKRVVMLNSGVGYFEHAGQINGNQQVEFPIKVEDINDLLKSLVVQDRDGGKVTAVNYGSPQPIAQTLKSLAIDVTRNPTLVQIFQQLRGQKVELTVTSDGKPVIGSVIGIEHRRVPGRDQQLVDTDYLLLRTEAGLRTIQVDSITLTKFLDEKTNREFQQALDLLAESRKQDRKTIKLDFRGEKQRQVSVGYVQESPVWKTTYRLVLNEDKPPFLQGWAIVENTTAQDWKDVDLTLISGRPISFQMDLYQPLFATRPVAELELHTSVEPRVYNQDLAAKEQEFRAQAGNVSGLPHGMAGMGGMGMGMGGMGGGMGGMAAGMGGGMGFGGPGGGPSPRKPIDLAEGVASAAAAEDVGELFRYIIKSPVTLRQNESAMLPIVNDPVKGSKVYIFNHTVHAKHPLAGLKLTNSTALHLQQGPITVFEEDEYAGDAQIADIPPNSTRLVTYAMDLDTEVVVTSGESTSVIESLRLQSGGINVNQLETSKTEYLIKNSGSRTKSILIEQPIDHAWDRVDPKPAEKTRDLYRFAVEAEPGKPQTLVVTDTRNVESRLIVRDFDTAKLNFYIESQHASPQVRELLQQFIKRRTAMHELTVARMDIEKSIQEANADQSRLRENLKALGPNDPLHQRYVQKLASSEDALEKLRPQLAAAQVAEGEYKKAFDKFAAEMGDE